MFSFLNKLIGGRGGVQNVTPLEAQDLASAGAVILDVRSPSERQSQHIEWSLHIPLGELANKASTLPRNETIICQCASGKRSQLAATQLAAQGFDVRNLQGGITAWQNAGLRVR